MALKEIINNEETIFIAPLELKDFFFESRKENPFLNFKFFTLDDVVRNLRGDYLNKNVLKIGLHFFDGLTYSNIKEIAKFVFYCNDISLSSDKKIVDFCDLIKGKGYLKFNKDFLNLLKNRKLIFINYTESSYVKNLLEKYQITNYSFIELFDLFEYEHNKPYHEFFNHGDELKYALNKILSEINSENIDNYKVILDLDRYDYYLKLFTSNLKIPIEIKKRRTLKDSALFKEIYSLVDDDFNVLEYLSLNRDNYDQEEFNTFYKAIEFFDLDTLKNKRINFKEIFSSISLNEDKYLHSLEFNKNITVSKSKNIFVLGLDNSFLPKVIKDTNYFSYDYLAKCGFDSLDETNIMKNKLEVAFLYQPSLRFISYHLKDNNGKYQKSYYLESSDFKKVNNEILKHEYVTDVSKLYYRNLFDKFIKNGLKNEELEMYKAFYGQELESYNPLFTRLKSYTYDEKKKHSYSSLKTLYLCPFSYYCDEILNLTINEKSIYQKYGTLAHSILEHAYEESFDFDSQAKVEINKLIERGNVVEPKEEVLLKRFLFELKKSVEIILLPHKEKMSYKTSYSEITVYANKDISGLDVNWESGESTPKVFHTTFKGTIDSVIETNENRLFIVDYKTGKDTFSKDAVFKYQLELQLPTYIYLIHNSTSRLFDNKEVYGVFLEKVIASDGRFYNYKNPTEDDLSCLKLDGAYLEDYETMLSFDYSIDDDKKQSLFVKGLQTASKGKKLSRAGAAKVRALNREEFAKLDKVVEENYFDCVRKIAAGSFHIEPYKKSSEYPGCKYCKHKDICFQRIKDLEEE